jgi:hypothetical protein
MNFAELTNTPGEYYSVAYWLACMLFISQSKKRISLWKCYVAQFVFLIAIVTFMELTADVSGILFIPCILLDVLMIFAVLYICCDISVLKAGYYCARAFILGEFVASFTWQIYYYSVLRLNVSTHILVNLLFVGASYFAIYLVMYYLEKQHYKENQNLQVTGRELLSVCIISILVFMMSNLSYVYENTPFSSKLAPDIFNIRTLVDLGGVAILLAYNVQLGELQMKFEVKTLQNMLNLQYANYQIAQQSIDMVNQKYHDLKHQIAILRAEVESKESMAYLDQMENEIKIYEAQNKTGNKIMDTVLTGKHIYCQNSGINLTVVADGTALDFMEPMDISTLFGNALDNAIESVRKLPQEEKRLIHVAVARQKDFLRIRVENYYEGNLVFENGLPATTKEDKEYHGYGLKSIRSTVKKYGGSITIDTNENWFELRILIPLPI